MPFNQKGIEFMAENRMQNSREWYAEHKEIYQENMLRPMQELVEALTPAMLKIDPQFVTAPKIGKTISRINRDTRFTHDKSIYRENIWLVFMREKRLYDGLPGFYFDLSPREYSYGCGYYKASNEAMDIIREMIVEDDPLFTDMVKAYDSQNLFEMYGESYKRNRWPNQPPEKQTWLNLKNFGFSRVGRDAELLFSDKLAPKLATELTVLAPMYRFMMAAEERRAERALERREAGLGAE